jgi:hypothetical protein
MNDIISLNSSQHGWHYGWNFEPLTFLNMDNIMSVNSSQHGWFYGWNFEPINFSQYGQYHES